MCCTRTFYNVDYALFAVERVYGKTVVYDCGGQRKPKIISQIKNAFKKDEGIEIVFISHYDRDHINGIYELLNYCKVKRLILPMLDDEDKLFLLLSHDYESEISDFVIDPQTAIKRYGRIEILPEIIFTEIDQTESIEPIDIGRLTNSIKSGQKLTLLDIPYWVYIPFNISTLSTAQKKWFISKLYSLHPQFKGKSVQEIWTSKDLNKSGIKKAVKPIIIKNGYTINATSLVLYSGHIDKNIKQGCLYLGDYDAKNYFSDLYNSYKLYWNTLKVIQIPHHGSDNNFNDNLIKPNIICIIPANKKITAKKPNYNKVALKIAQFNGIPFITGYCGDIEIQADGKSSQIITLK